MIGTRVGNYEIKAKLGEGGMGAVYLGEHPLIGKRVAIKVLLEDYVKNEAIATRFFHEAKAANDIRHQNIVDIVDFGRLPKEDGGFIVYIVMELLEGQSLSARLDAQRPTFDETRHILRQCCSGLAASHAKGIIHRDLKPDNLFLVQRGDDPNFVKILDFGIAKLTLTSSTNAKTRTGTLIGTPAYMSPEQCAGRGKIDARSDIYSLGIVMYEMLTGQVPFKGDGFGDIVVAHLTETAQPPSALRADIPPELDAIVMRAIEKDPERRFQSMEEMGLALADPAAFLNRPTAVAEAGAAAAAPTAAVQVVADAPSARQPVAQLPPDAETMVAAARPKSKTTLSEAASEVRPPARSRVRVALIGTVAVAVVGGVGALALVRSGGTTSAPPLAVTPAPRPAPPKVTPPPVPQPAAPAEVMITLTSEPAGAEVVRTDEGERVLGTTPLTMKLPRGSPSFAVELRHPGYRTERRTISAAVNLQIDVNLLREPRRAARASTSPPAAPTGTPGVARTAAPGTKPAAPATTKPAAPATTKPAAPATSPPAQKPKTESPDPDRLILPPEL